MTRDFSQSGEEAMILKWADRHGPGRFLDIGGYDGETASNSRALALAGWSGVLVEPAAIPFDRLATLYADRPDVHCLNAALVPVVESRVLPFYMSHDLVSTTSERNRETWSDLAEFVPAHVVALSVDELLTAFPGPYSMVSIDTEGSSLALWDALRSRDVFAPGALVVVEAEDGVERWTVQHKPAHEGWARVGVTPNNVLLSRIT